MTVSVLVLATHNQANLGGQSTRIRAVVSGVNGKHRLRLFTASVALLALGVPSAASPSSRVRVDDVGAPRVTLIGDSVPDSLRWGPATAIVADGIDLELDTAACRRTEVQSCLVQGQPRPQTLIQLAQSEGGSLGQTVVVMIGYNDFEVGYRDVIGAALDALDRAGVTHILWLNLHEARGPYVPMNEAIDSWQPSHPELTVLDWNRYSRSHLDWFRPDGVHVTPDGTIGLATFIHSALVDAGVALPPAAASGSPLRVVSKTLPAASAGAPYSAQLVGAGGDARYRWKALGKLPEGFEVAHDGLVTGIPHSGPGTFDLTFRVSDAAGAKAVGRVALTVTR